MAVGAASLKKTSWYRNIIILLGVEEHPNYALNNYNNWLFCHCWHNLLNSFIQRQTCKLQFILWILKTPIKWPVNFSKVYYYGQGGRNLYQSYHWSRQSVCYSWTYSCCSTVRDFFNGVYKFCLTEHTSSSLANIWSQENHSKWLLLFSRIPIDEHIIYLELHMQICPPQFKFKFQEREPLSLVKSVSVILGPPS